MRMSCGCPIAVVHRWRWCVCVHMCLRKCSGGFFFGFVFFCFFLGGAQDSGEVCSRYFCPCFCQFLLTKARRAISIMYDVRVVGKNGVTFPLGIERKQNHNLIVCKGRLGWLNLIVFHCSESNRRRHKEARKRGGVWGAIMVQKYCIKKLSFSSKFVWDCMQSVCDSGGKQKRRQTDSSHGVWWNSLNCMETDSQGRSGAARCISSMSSLS